MSAARSSRSAEPVPPTRQQLDELDALLKRMLDLPVNQLEEPPPPEPEAPTPEATAPPRTAGPPVSYVVVETAQPSEPPPAPKEDDGDWVPLRSSWQPSDQTWGPLAEKWLQAHAPGGLSVELPAPPESPAPPPAPEEKPVAAPETTATAAPPPPAEEDAPPVPWPLWPLVGFNKLFDACLSPLGGLGRWLSSPPGRWVLGFVGLLCLGAALVLAFGPGFGWPL
jgi:hypothetical protein